MIGQQFDSVPLVSRFFLESCFYLTILPILVCWLIWVVFARILPIYLFERDCKRAAAKALKKKPIPSSEELGMFDKLLDFVVNAVRQEERRKAEDKERQEDPKRPVTPWQFTIIKEAGELVSALKEKMVYHKEREQKWTLALEEAEKKLREEGISLEAFDTVAHQYQSYGSIASGCINSNTSHIQPQPQVDQKLLGDVKHAKERMLYHRGEAEKAEKLARAYSQDPTKEIRLGVEDIHYFRLPF